MRELDKLVEQANANGQAILVPRAHWTMCGHLAQQVANRSQRDGPIAAVDFAADRLESNMRTSRLRNAAYALISGEAAGEIAEHLENRLRNEGGTAMMAALYTLACHQAARSPDLKLTSALNWCAALQRLFDDMPVERLETLIKPACSLYPDMGFLRELKEITELTPRLPSRFTDTMEASVQLVSAADTNARCLVVAMSGGEGRLGLPHTILHQWFAAQPAHMLYLRDTTGRFYHHGIEALGADWPAMIEGIQDDCRTNGNVTKSPFSATAPQEFPAFGRACSLAPDALSPSVRVRTATAGPAGPNGSSEARMAALNRDLPNLTSDWAGSTQPEILIVHGDTNKQDKLFAGIMADTPAVTTLGTAQAEPPQRPA